MGWDGVCGYVDIAISRKDRWLWRCRYKRTFIILIEIQLMIFYGHLSIHLFVWRPQLYVSKRLATEEEKKNQNEEKKNPPRHMPFSLWIELIWYIIKRQLMRSIVSHRLCASNFSSVNSINYWAHTHTHTHTRTCKRKKEKPPYIKL